MEITCRFPLRGASRALRELREGLQEPWFFGWPEPLVRFWDSDQGYGEYRTASGLGRYEFAIERSGKTRALIVRFSGRRNSFLSGTPAFRLLVDGLVWESRADAWLDLPTIRIRGEVVRAETSRPDLPLGQ